MTMAWNIEQLRGTGKDGDKVLADMMEWRLKAEGDFDFPEELQKLELHPIGLEKSETEPAGETSETTLTHKPRPLGHIALADAAEDLHSIVESIDIEATPTLNAEMQEIFLPLVAAAKNKMPLPGPDDKTKFGRLKKTNEHVWFYSQVIENKVLHYYFQLKYVPGKEVNTLTELVIAFGGKPKDSHNDYTATVEFDDDSIKRFAIFDRAAWDGFEVSPLRQLMQNDIPLERIKDGKIKTKWDEDLLGGMVFDDYKSVDQDRYYHRHLLHCSLSHVILENQWSYGGIARSYDPDSGVFKTTRTNEVGEILGKSIDVAQIKQLAQAFMNLVPLREAAAIELNAL
jgi:hypothetical protein